MLSLVVFIGTGVLYILKNQIQRTATPKKNQNTKHQKLQNKKKCKNACVKNG
jgi:hypothetical protein